MIQVSIASRKGMNHASCWQNIPRFTKLPMEDGREPVMRLSPSQSSCSDATIPTSGLMVPARRFSETLYILNLESPPMSTIAGPDKLLASTSNTSRLVNSSRMSGMGPTSILV